MTISKTINETKIARNFSDVLDQVKYQETTFDVIRGRDIVARIVSARPALGLKVSDLNNLFARLPHLDEGDAEVFEHDIRESVAFLNDKNNGF